MGSIQKRGLHKHPLNNPKKPSAGPAAAAAAAPAGLALGTSRDLVASALASPMVGGLIDTFDSTSTWKDMKM